MPLGIQQGGAEALLRSLLALPGSRHAYICAFLEDGSLVKEIRGLGVPTVVFARPEQRYLRGHFFVIRAIRSWIDHHRPDVVLSWMPKAHLYVAPALLFRSTLAMWYQHGTPRGQFLDIITTLLPAETILCCSQASKACQNRLFPRRSTVVCYPGIDLSSRTFSRQFARQQLGLSNTVPVIGMVARLERWKGIHVFVEAARLIAKTHPNAIFFVAGGAHSRDMPYAAEIDRQLEDAALGSSFLLLGQRTPHEVTLWQTAANVIVHPPIGVEPFGMAVVEAMAAGTPVIASNIAGPAEIITNHVDGVLIPLGQPSAIAESALGLLDDSAVSSRIAAAGLERSHFFSVAVFHARIDSILSGKSDE
jgi:glycosyltransferase involved in cell wall biosynthesis